MTGPLKDEFTLLPPGQIAAVVTHLEMRTQLPLRRDHVKQGEYALRRQTAPDLGWYRELYRRVGQDWLWFSRLAMDDAALLAIPTTKPSRCMRSAIAAATRASSKSTSAGFPIPRLRFSASFLHCSARGRGAI